MLSGFFKVLNVEPKEQKQASLLLGQGFFMGIFTASFGVASMTLFLSEFSESYIPLKFIASGVIGVILTYIFSILQNRIPFRIASFFFLGLFILFIAGVLYGVFDPELQHQAIFIAYALAEPITVVMLLVFWGSFNRIFTLRQSKRIIGGIDTGQLVAAVLGYFSIPQLSRVLPETEDLFFVSFFALVAYFLLFFITSRQYSLKINLDESGKEIKKSISVKGFLKNRFVILMSIFVIVSAVSLEFLDYTFQVAAKRQFLAEEDLKVFISYFEMAIVIFSFLFQTFTTDKIISEYGLKVALLINPVLLLITTCIALGVGVFTGITAAGEYFIYFFVVIAMIRLFIASLRDALDGPSFKLYFLPIDPRYRLDIQSKVEGIITVVSGIISGGIILLIERFPVFSIWHILLFMLPLIGFWYFITTRMYGRYKKTLMETLEKNKTKVKRSIRNIRSQLLGDLRGNNPEKAIHAMHAMQDVDPLLFEEALLQIEGRNDLSSNLAENADQSLESKLRERNTTVRNSQIERDMKLVRDEALDAFSSGTGVSTFPSSKLYQLAKSRYAEDRLFSLEILKKTISDENAFILQELMRDIRPEVRTQAIIAARELKRKEAWPILIELLAHPRFAHQAMASIIDIGEAIIPSLNVAFSKSGQSEDVMLRIISCVIRIGGNKAIQMLWQNIDYPLKKIQWTILEGFYDLGYTAKGEYVTKITTFIKEEVGKGVWNMAALTEIPEDEAYQPIKMALEEELARNYENLYKLLSIIYDHESVHLIKENIEGGSNEDITFAIELMDIFLSNDLKLILFPFFDDIPTSEKVRKLKIFYPREELDPEQLLLHILNRDIHMSGRYTKAAALYALVQTRESFTQREVVSQLFNSDPLLYELAAEIVIQRDRKTYLQMAERLPEGHQSRIFSLFLDPNAQKLSQFAITQRLLQSEAFQKANAEAVSEVAMITSLQKFTAGEELNTKDHIFVVESGSVTDDQGNQVPPGQSVATFGSVRKLICKTESAFLMISKEKFFYLISVNEDLADFLVGLIDQDELVSS